MNLFKLYLFKKLPNFDLRKFSKQSTRISSDLSPREYQVIRLWGKIILLEDKLTFIPLYLRWNKFAPFFKTKW